MISITVNIVNEQSTVCAIQSTGVHVIPFQDAWLIRKVNMHLDMLFHKQIHSLLNKLF